jgi:hypothetical protein
MDNAARFDGASFRRGFLDEVEAAQASESRRRMGDRKPLRSARLARRAAREVQR